jgi:hypothetical protein
MTFILCETRVQITDIQIAPGSTILYHMLILIGANKAAHGVHFDNAAFGGTFVKIK